MSKAYDYESKEIISDLNQLYDWSLRTDDLVQEVQNRLSEDYIAWKLPFSGAYTDAEQQNRAIRSFCVERLIFKMRCHYLSARDIQLGTEIFRLYCVISEPDLWTSEVGAVLSLEKWNDMLYRSVSTNSYCERTTPSNRTLWDAFGVMKPLDVCYMHMTHTIEDMDENISFRGGLHVLWIDCCNKA
jgi:hypothetical protein